MTHILFAGNMESAKGGADDLVGTYQHLDDHTAFVALMDETYLRRIHPAPRIWANAYSCDGDNLGSRRHWEFRMAPSLDDPSLKFCTHKADAAGLGPCGIIPLGRRVERRVERIGTIEVSVFYAINDPQQQNIEQV